MSLTFIKNEIYNNLEFKHLHRHTKINLNFLRFESNPMTIVYLVKIMHLIFNTFAILVVITRGL